MRYNFAQIQKEVQAYWEKHQIHRTKESLDQPKAYILDMFPYPSGYSLHLGHLVGYFPSDALAIFFRLRGYNVLHPMGFDAFGLPAEQHAVDTGQHPSDTVGQNIAAYRRVLQAAGLTFDWERSFSTTDPDYYRWTQWIFIQLFDSWYDHDHDRARPILELEEILAKKGNEHLRVLGASPPHVTPQDWQRMSAKEQQNILAYYRLAYLAETTVNWCPALGTVLANDEVKDGFSERGGHPVVQKKMRQWHLRIVSYADRLLTGLEKITWPSSVKEMQRNWIGRSEGADIIFPIAHSGWQPITIFTTRPDTLFGVTYLALAPEHPIVETILAYLKSQDASENSPYQKLKNYLTVALQRAERKRMEQESLQGCFTHLYALHPITQQKIPIWIADYVLPAYGSGAIMAVPAHDARDHAFAQHFNLPIVRVIANDKEESLPYEGKVGKMIHAEFCNGLTTKEAQEKIVKHLVDHQKGRPRVAYRLRDAVFSRQRYWGEPFPIYYKEDMPYALPNEKLPLRLPKIDSYKPTSDGAPPLARAKNWETTAGYRLEYNTMPAWAASSWYFLRYMDPHNKQHFVSPQAINYWKQVDYYIGGAEHTTGHLLYARFFTKVLHDLGYLPFDEPFRHLINQGMLQSESALVYRIKKTNQFVSHGLRKDYDIVPMYVDTRFVKNNKLDLTAFKKWRPDLADATFILEDGAYICGRELEKMSKSKHNAIEPLEMINRYGADALRLHLLFLGPIAQTKHWNSQGIEGSVRLLKKIWTLFYDKENKYCVTQEEPTQEAQAALHQAIAQITDQIQRYAFNTCVSALMVLVNRLVELKTHQHDILVKLPPLLAPFAPHMAEALWQKIGNTPTVFSASFPLHDPTYLTKKEVTYPVAINGKRRALLTLPIDMEQQTIIAQALALPSINKWIAGKKPKRIIVIPKRMINIVL